MDNLCILCYSWRLTSAHSLFDCI